MTEQRALLADTVEKILARTPDSDIVGSSAAIEATGLGGILIAESAGGFGGGWEDVFVVLHATGYHTKLLGLAEEIVANSRKSADGDEIMRYMGLVRACQMAGAMQAALDLSVKYVRERQQFGKPLASFQAIQQQLAVFAEECAATNTAAVAACRAADRGPARFEIACAKLRANIAVGTATSVAHQVHGAMGFTAEYKLQRLTKLLWAWRGEYGNDRYWANTLGKLAAAQGAGGFWAALVSPATIGAPGSAD